VSLSGNSATTAGFIANSIRDEADSSTAFLHSLSVIQCTMVQRRSNSIMQIDAWSSFMYVDTVHANN
jgi:hypothetical protein